VAVQREDWRERAPAAASVSAKLAARQIRTVVSPLAVARVSPSG
jgi:hypothetical protein